MAEYPVVEQVYAETVPIINNGADYDTTRYISRYGMPDQRNGQHLTDTYKLPNHPTFSDGSMYSRMGMRGGEWRQQAPYQDKYTFVASDQNRRNMGPLQLGNYFRKVEPGNALQYAPK